MPEPLLSVENLSVAYANEELREALSGINFTLQRGERLGLIGESGSGKTTLAMSILRLLPPFAVVRGLIKLDGTDVGALPELSFRPLRWRALSLVFQGAMNALNPVLTVRQHFDEISRYHCYPTTAPKPLEALLALVGLEVAVAARFPHELSGGMKQRVMIALALMLEPRLLIADEPTSALDVIVQAEILNGLLRLQEQFGFGLLLISHDLAVVRGLCTRIGVMYAGELVDIGQTASVLAGRHPYTRSLLRASAGEGSQSACSRPTPHLAHSQSDGCRFAARCPSVQEQCRTERPTLRAMAAGHEAACHFPLGEEPIVKIAGVSVSRAAAKQRGPSLTARNLVKEYHPQSGLLGLFGQRPPIRAVDNVSVELHSGRVLAIVGESGSGKSTLGRLLGFLERPTAGQVLLAGKDVWENQGSDRPGQRLSVQFVFQDPYDSLNPRHPIRDIVGEAAWVHRLVRRHEVENYVADLLAQVDLPVAFLRKRPHELSGGQRQRVAIARALALQPSVLIADEPTSMLDVLIQDGILTLLQRLQRDRQLSIVFITHDVGVARRMADDVIVLYRGRVVESGEAAHVLNAPTHAYTSALLEASIDRLYVGRWRELVS